MSNHLHGTSNSSSAAAAPTASGMHSWSSGWDPYGPGTTAAQPDVSATSGPINGYSVTGSHLHAAQLHPPEHSEFLGIEPFQITGRDHHIQVGERSGHTNQMLVTQGQFLAHGYGGFPPEAGAGDASMAAFHQHVYKGNYDQEQPWVPGRVVPGEQQMPYAAFQEDARYTTSGYRSSADVPLHLEAHNPHVQVANLAVGEQYGSSLSQPGIDLADHHGPPCDSAPSVENTAQEAIMLAASNGSSNLGRRGPTIETTRALPAGTARDFYESEPSTSGTHPNTKMEADSSTWVSAAAAPDVSASASQCSSISSSNPSVDEKEAVPSEVMSEPRRLSGTADSSSIADRPRLDGHDRAQLRRAPELGLGDMHHSTGGGGGAPTPASIPKPDILGEPFSSMHSMQDDSVQPDILADPCFHQPRQHGEQSRQRSSGSSESAAAAQAARSLGPDAPVPGASAAQPMQHSVAIGYEPISAHSQSAFKAVGGTGRPSGSGKAESAAGGGLVRSPSPALWQSAPPQPTVYLQPIASGSAGLATPRSSGAESVVQERAAAANRTDIGGAGRGGGGLAAAAAAASILNGTPGDGSAATVATGAFAGHRNHVGEAVAASADFSAPSGVHAMSFFANEEPAAATVRTIVPHHVPVPVFLRPPHEAGLAPSFGHSGHEVGTGTSLHSNAAEATARRPSAEAVASSFGQVPAQSTAGNAPGAPLHLQPDSQFTSAAGLSQMPPSARDGPHPHMVTSQATAAMPMAAAAALPGSHGQNHLGPQVASGPVDSPPIYHHQQLTGSSVARADGESARPGEEGNTVKPAAMQQQRPADHLSQPQSSYRDMTSQAPQLRPSPAVETYAESYERSSTAAPLAAAAGQQLGRSSAAASFVSSSAQSVPGTQPVTDNPGQQRFSALDPVGGLRSSGVASYASDVSAASSSSKFFSGEQLQGPGRREVHPAPADRTPTSSVHGISHEPQAAAPAGFVSLHGSVQPAQTGDGDARVALQPVQGHVAQAAQGYGGAEAGRAPPVMEVDPRFLATASGRQLSHDSSPALQDPSRLPAPQGALGQPSAPRVSPSQNQRGGYLPYPDNAYPAVHSDPTDGRSGYAHPHQQEGSQLPPRAYGALPSQGNSEYSAQPPYGGSSIPGVGHAPSGLAAAAAAGTLPSASYPGAPATQNTGSWQQQQHTTLPVAQGYSQHSGAAQPVNAYSSFNQSGQYQPYDRRPPSVPPNAQYADYYAQYYGGQGYGHFVGQDPYGGFQNRGYAYDRQSHPYYDPHRGAYSRGYLDELNTYAQQQAAAAAAYGSLYDYYQQYQQYYNAVQDSQSQLAHSRSSSRAVTPAIQNRDDRSGYADNLSGYYPSRPESAASMGVYPNGAAVGSTVQHDMPPDPCDDFAGDTSISLHDVPAAGTADYQDYSYAADNHGAINATAPSAPSRKTPACFPLPHSRACFSRCGKLIVVLANNPGEGQPALVQLHDLKHFLDQSATGDSQPQTEYANLSFPLIRGQTHKKDVIEFCDRQADKCRTSTGIHDRESSELMWRFLALLVKQNGTYVGSDVAELLLAGQDNVLGGYKRHSQVQEAAAAVSQKSIDALTDRFRELLLYGHIKEALDFAAKNELWGHALCLASKMDDRTLASVIARFTTSSMRSNDPLQTLYQLMSNKQPSVVTSIADDKWGSWRPHLAMMLVNAGNSTLIRPSVVQLGDTLAAKGQLVASQFCYIMADLSFESYSRKSAKLCLLGAHTRMPEKEFLSTAYVEWTEVYEYAQSLGNPIFVMPNLQTYKLVKAWKHFEHGHLCEALRYCEAIAEKVVAQPSLFAAEMVKQLVELSTSLKYQNVEAAQHLGAGGFVDISCSLPLLDQLTTVYERLRAGTYDANMVPPASNAHGTGSELLPGGAPAPSVAATDLPSRSAPHHQGPNQMSGLQLYPTTVAAADFTSASTTNTHQHCGTDVTTSAATYADTSAGGSDTGHPPWTYNHQGDVSGLPELPPTKHSLNQQPQQPANPSQWGAGDSSHDLQAHYHQTISAYSQQQPQAPWMQRPASESQEETLSTASDDTGESMDEDYARHNPPQSGEQPKPTEVRSATEPRPNRDTGEKKKPPSRGLFGMFGYFSKTKTQKAPKAAEMKLPDDKVKTIVWDSARERWVDTAGGSEEEKVVGPPPQMRPPIVSTASKGSVPSQDLPPGGSPNIFSMARGKRLPTYVDPFKGKPSVASSPVPSLLREGRSSNPPVNVLTPVGFMPTAQSNADAATSSEQFQISRNESSASLEVQNIMSTNVQDAAQPATSQPVVPAGPSFYDPSQFTHSIPASTTKQRLNRRV